MFLWQLPASNTSNTPPSFWPWLDRDYGFINKPAADVVSAWYSEPQAAIRRMADRVFDWEEATYAGIISPARTPSQESGGFYFRYYSRTGNYVGVLGNRLFYLDPGSGPARDLGTLTSWFVNIP